MKFKPTRSVLRNAVIVLTAILFVSICSECFAMDEGSGGRKLWNYIMLWVNFGILVFLFFKFAKKPLMNFLHEEGNKISQRIEQVEGEVAKARGLLETEAEKFSDMDSRIDDIKNQIIETGKREKEEIIEKARILAGKMIDDAREEAEYRKDAARKRFSEEMLNLAVSHAVGELKKNITLEDHEKIVESFSMNLYAAKDLF